MSGQVKRRGHVGRRIASALLALGVASGLAPDAVAQESAVAGGAPEGVSDAFLKNVTLLGVPSATAAPNGLVFLSLSGTDRRDGLDDDEDGSAAVGFGVGVSDAVNLQFTANITSLEDNFADSGFLTVKASRQIGSSDLPTFISLTGDALAPWGDSDDLDQSATIAFTTFPVWTAGRQAFPLMITAGAGTHVRDFRTEPGAFAGIGIGLTEAFGASIAHDGDHVDLGAAFRVPGLDNFGLNVTADDAFDMDDRQRVTLSLIWVIDNVF